MIRQGLRWRRRGGSSTWSPRRTASIWSWDLPPQAMRTAAPVKPFLRQSTPLPLRERRHGHPPETQRASGKARRYRDGYEGRVLASKPRPLLKTWYLPLCQKCGSSNSPLCGRATTATSNVSGRVHNPKRAPATRLDQIDLELEHAGDEAAGHQRPPEVDVAADQKGRHAHAHRVLRSRGDEGEGVDELLGDEREAEDDHGEDAGHRDGNHDPDEGAEPAKTIDHGGLFDVGRDGLEEAHEEPGAEGHGEGRVDQDQGPERVLEPDGGDQAGQGDKEQGRGHEIGEEDPDAELLAPAAGEAGEGVAGGERQRERDGDHDDADEGRVPEPAAVEGVLEEHP